MEFTKPLISLSPSEFAFQIINTVVMFLILKKFLFSPVQNIMAARENDIQRDLSEGKRAKDEGLSLKKDYEQKISTAKEEGQEIIKQATLRAEQKSTEIIASAREEAIGMKEKANKDIQLEKQKAMNEIKNEISEIAIMAASKVIEQDLDKSKHDKLINNFIKEVGEAK